MCKAPTVRRGHKRAVVAIANHMARVIFAILCDRRPYRDPHIDYEALLVKCNALRWLCQLREFGILASNGDGTGRWAGKLPELAAAPATRPFGGAVRPGRSLAARTTSSATHRRRWVALVPGVPTWPRHFTAGNRIGHICRDSVAPVMEQFAA